MKKILWIALLGLSTNTFANNSAINNAKNIIKSTLKDPDSTQFQDVRVVTNTKGEKSICGYYNSKNSYGGYVGYEGFNSDIKTGMLKSIAGLDDYTLAGCNGKQAELKLRLELVEVKKQLAEKEIQTGINKYVYARSSEICKAYSEFLQQVIKKKKPAEVAFEDIKSDINNDRFTYKTISPNKNVFANFDYYKEYKPSNEEYTKLLNEIKNDPKKYVEVKYGFTEEQIEQGMKKAMPNCIENQSTLYYGKPLPQLEVYEKEESIEDDEQIIEWKKVVLNKVIRSWGKPESLDGMIDTKMSVFVDKNGKLLNLSWVERTNNRKLDRSIVNAFKDAAPFPPPPINSLNLPNLRVIITFPAQK